MPKPIGTSKLMVRQAPNKEWGIWRLNEEKIPYLLLTQPDLDETIGLAKKMGRKLSLSVVINKSLFY